MYVIMILRSLKRRNKKYKLEEIKDERIAYMRIVGPYGMENKMLMEDLKKWAINNNVFNDSTIYGIAWDGPNVEPSKCRYDVCIVINNDMVLDNSVIDGKLEGGKYAIFEINHITESIQEFWNQIPQILSILNYDFNKPILERYQEKLINNNKCEFCIPLK